MVKTIALIGFKFLRSVEHQGSISQLIERQVFLKIKAHGFKKSRLKKCRIMDTAPLPFSPSLLQATVQKICYSTPARSTITAEDNQCSSGGTSFAA
jgi:hypothetical protein